MFECLTFSNFKSKKDYKVILSQNLLGKSNKKSYFKSQQKM